MYEKVSRIMCGFCRGGGVVWAPRMAVQWGNRETFSLAAPTRCPECGGGGWFEMACAQPAEEGGATGRDRPDDR